MEGAGCARCRLGCQIEVQRRGNCRFHVLKQVELLDAADDTDHDQDHVTLLVQTRRIRVDETRLVESVCVIVIVIIIVIVVSGIEKIIKKTK